ncbi:ABC transporter ATP-binding protein [bacterium]|nr:ABC transporter ATP-binding protein [bacterium]
MQQDLENSAPITLTAVTVAYRSYQKRPTSLKETILKLLTQGKVKYYSTLDALSGLTLSVKKGSVLGIIGSNGSGKSTLLKVLAQVLKPTSGKVTIQGTVASLIDLGVGFDHELNAIENIYLNGSLYGRTRAQIEARVPGIIEFSELQDFSETPIKYFSSGMVARLGFACAIDVNPDILLVDEVLSVGDERFQQKCHDRIQQFLKTDRTVIMVSHDMKVIEEMCDEVAVLSRGQLIYLGAAAEAIACYRDEHYQTRLGAHFDNPQVIV